MATNNKVVIKFLADTDQMRRGIQNVDKQLSGFTKGIKRFALTFGAAFSAKAIVDFAKDSVGAASDLEESISKVGAVFQDSAINIQNWAKDSSTAFGLSKQAALEAAGTFGNLFTAFGVGIPEAEKMSTALVELAADLASFNNTSVDEAITALRSGLSGETEPLKRFGVALNQAAIEAKALELGLMSAGETISQAAKTQAIFALVMEQTATAQGDFARTSDGLANTMRTLSAAVDDAKAKIGRGLLSAVQSATDAAGGGEGLAGTIDEVATEFELLGVGIGVLIDKLNELTPTTEDTEEAEKGLERQTRSLWKAFLSGGDPVVGVGVALQTLIYNLGVVEDQAESNRLGQKLLEDGYRANASAARDNASANYELAASYTAVLRQLGNLPNDKILRTERQGDSFLRGFNDGDREWRKAQEVVREIGFDFDDLTEKVGGAGSALKDTGKEAEEAASILEKELERALEETQRQIDEWRNTITSKMNLGKAFQEANDATARRDALQLELGELRADPNATAEAIAELEKELAEAGAEAGKGFLTFFAEQATDAEQLARNLANLDAAGLNQAIIQQIASDSNGAALSQAIVDGITSDGYGVLDQLNRQASRIENAGTQLGETLVEPLPAAGAQGGEDFLFGLKGAGKEGNGLLNQVKADAPRVKKAIKNSLRTSVEVKVIYTPDTSRLDGAPGGRSVVRSVQDFERLNGKKWRDRVR